MSDATPDAGSITTDEQTLRSAGILGIDAPDLIDLRKRSLFFESAGLTFALPILAVVEVCPLPALSPLPFAKEWECGLCDVRGEPVCAMDLSLLLGLATPRGTRGRRLVVARGLSTDVTCGLVVDRTLGLRLVADDDVLPLDADDDGPEAFLTGVYESADGPVAFLDLDRLISEKLV